MAKTVLQLVEAVHRAATEMEMDLSPQDVGTIISLFFEGMAASSDESSAMDDWLMKIAEECQSIRNE